MVNKRWGNGHEAESVTTAPILLYSLLLLITMIRYVESIPTCNHLIQLTSREANMLLNVKP